VSDDLVITLIWCFLNPSVDMFFFFTSSFVNDAREEFAYTLLMKKKVNGLIKEKKN
jgi:hypothetical protein